MSTFAPQEFFSQATHMHTVRKTSTDLSHCLLFVHCMVGVINILECMLQGTVIASLALVLSAIAVWRTTKKDDYE